MLSIMSIKIQGDEGRISAGGDDAVFSMLLDMQCNEATEDSESICTA